MCYSEGMDFATILNLFGNSVPLGIVFLIAHQVYIANEIKHIRKDLTNHVTDTNKKIDQLTDRFDRLNDRFDRLYEIILKDKEQK